MQQQEFFTIEDFVFNTSFRDWILKNNSPDREFWEKWIKDNPGKINVLNYAKAIVYALSANHKQLSDKEIDEEIQAILNKATTLKTIHEEKSRKVHEYTHTPIVKRMYRWVAGIAAVAILTIFSVFYLQNKNSAESKRSAFYELPASENNSSAIEQVNNSDTIQLATLFDGSKVQLYPKSKLSFSHGSFSKKREVYLTGEAFFDVKKNPSAPFFVYTRDMVTKVLGTSFLVKAYATERTASVMVRTGKVSVYKKENFSEINTVANKLDGLIVTPNQQVIYDLVNNQLSKTIVDKPAVVANNKPEVFVFNSTPLKDVFKTLQNAYGITIMYDESVISSCSLSASLGNENFYEKLELICKAIDASYESIDGTIYITAHGCQ